MAVIIQNGYYEVQEKCLYSVGIAASTFVVTTFFKVAALLVLSSFLSELYKSLARTFNEIVVCYSLKHSKVISR
jgi:hypothetical protein